MSRQRLLVPSLLFISLVVAAVGSLGAPLITSVATTFHVSLASAQWTLTITLLSGAIATPLLGRMGAGPHRRGTVLTTLGIVAAGSLLTVLPLPFAWLLAGRAAQGAGLGLTALMMGVARDHLGKERAQATIALVSVASTIGIGVGGAALLGGGLLCLLSVLSHAGIALTVLGVSLLGAWVAWELRVSSPLVDITLLRHRSVAGANVAMLTGGVGMYLLLSLITRYAQTPHGAGYGFGLSAFTAGLVLVPFSLLGFAAGKLAPVVRRRIGAPGLLAASAVVVLGAFALFALARSGLAELLLEMAILGLGVGSFSAAMPAVILSVTPEEETSSAMSFNQVVRSGGFSVGSAVGGLILATGTSAGHLFPADGAYTTAAWLGAAVMAVTAIICAGLRRPEVLSSGPVPSDATAR